MARVRESHPRSWSFVLLPLSAVAVVIIAGFTAWSLLVAFDESDGDAGGGPVTATSPSPSPVTADEVDAAFDAALARGALAGDRAAWSEALPARGKGAAALRAIYSRLASLEFGELDAHVTPIPGQPGVFEIEITGTPGGAGPDDRILVDRVLEFARGDSAGDDPGSGDGAGRGGGVVAVGDRTPAATKRQYLMAYERPQMVRADGAVTISDEAAVPKARQVALMIPAARERVAEVLGERSRRPIVVFVYSSRRQLADYLGESVVDDRVTFFSRVPTTLSGHPWSPADIGVVTRGPLPYGDDELQSIVTHETTHAVTWRLFYDTEHDPVLLAEGLAVATADNRSYDALRNDLLDGRLRLPLLDAFAIGSVWRGNDTDYVTLAYLEAGATVDYILETWGLDGLKRFSRGIADSELTRPAVKRVVRDELGVGWAAFYEGWLEHLETLP